MLICWSHHSCVSKSHIINSNMLLLACGTSIIDNGSRWRCLKSKIVSMYVRIEPMGSVLCSRCFENNFSSHYTLHTLSFLVWYGYGLQDIKIDEWPLFSVLSPDELANHDNFEKLMYFIVQIKGGSSCQIFFAVAILSSMRSLTVLIWISPPPQ